MRPIVFVTSTPLGTLREGALKRYYELWDLIRSQQRAFTQSIARTVRATTSRTWSYNMGRDSKRKGVRKGDLTDEIVRNSRQVSVTQKSLVQQIIEFLPKLELTMEEVVTIRQILDGKLVHKTCSVCLKSKTALDGELRFRDGDMSKPKVFVCKECL